MKLNEIEEVGKVVQDPKTLDERSFGKMEYDYLKEMKYNLDNTNGKWVMEK